MNEIFEKIHKHVERLEQENKQLQEAFDTQAKVHDKLNKDYIEVRENNKFLRKEIDIHLQQLSLNAGMLNDNQQVIMQQQKEVNRLREALEFYADIEKFLEIATHGFNSELSRDGGHIARQALEARK